MIKLKHLGLQNFLSHVDTKLSMEEYQGLVLIEGQNVDGHYSSNGSGKSTLLEGIVYALTGDTLRGVSVNDVVNRNYGKNTKVSLSFEKADTSYSVSRYRKDEAMGDAIVLLKGEENISKRVNKETQKSIEDILGISYKVLVSTMLLGEGLSSRFTQLSDPEKKSLIESTLNLNYDIAAIKTKANTKLSQLKLDKSNLDGRLSTMRELSNLDIEETQRKVEQYKLEAAKLTDRIEAMKASAVSLRANDESLQSKVSLLKDTRIQIMRTQEYLKGQYSELAEYQREIESMNTINPCCNVCHQPLLSQESRSSYVKTYQEKIDRLQESISSTESSLASFPPLDVVEEKLVQLTHDKMLIAEEIRKLDVEYELVSKDLWNMQSMISREESLLESQQSAEGVIATLSESEKQLSTSIEQYDYFSKLFSPTGIIVNILSDAIGYINSRLKAYSQLLLEKNYRLSFVKGKISLVDSHGASYQSLSNGEKRRLDISIQFALHDYVQTYCGMQMDTLFIDEILDTLDDIGVDNIFEVLRLKLDYCNLKSIYVITHNNLLKDKFDNIITIKKDANGDSKVAYH